MSQETTEIRMTPETIAMLRQTMNERSNRFRLVNWVMSFGCGATVITSLVGCFLLVTTFLPELEIVASQLPALIIERLAPAAGVQIQMPDSSQAPVVVVTATPLPTLPPTPTVTSTLPPPRVRALTNANLRSAPDLQSDSIGLIGPRAVANIVARSQNAAWYLINQNNRLAWVSASVVQIEAPQGIGSVPIWGETLTTVSAVGDLSFQNGADPSRNLGRSARPNPLQQYIATPIPPTPIPGNVERVYWENTRGGFLWIQRHAYLPQEINDAQFSPTDGGKFITSSDTQILRIFGDGSGSDIILSDNNIVFEGDVSWSAPFDMIFSPDGAYIAFVINSGNQRCLDTPGHSPCRTVAVMDMTTKQVITLRGPLGTNYFGIPNSVMDLEAPRWLDGSIPENRGKLMVLAHPNEPARGQAYVYDTIGASERAELGTVYFLDVSKDAQKFYPWVNTKKKWQRGSSEREDSYYK